MDRPILVCLFERNGSPDDEPFRQPFEKIAGLQILGEFSTWESLEECAKRYEADVIAVSLDDDPDGTLRVVERIGRSIPGCGVIGISRTTDPQTIIRAMRAGCAQFVCRPVDVADLKSAIDRIRSSRPLAPVESKRICVIGASGGAGATAVSCNLAIAMLFKYSELRGLDRAALLTVNYAVASTVAAILFAFTGQGGRLSVGSGMLALGVGTGVLFIGGYYLFAYSIREAGMGLATGIVKIAVVLPVLVSWFIWEEIPSPFQMAGLVLAGAAFFLIAQPGAPAGLPRGAPHKHGRLWMVGVLGLLFLSGGLVDIAMKTFGEVYASTNSRSLFLLFVFSVAFLVGVGLVVGKGMRTRQWPERPVYGWGLVPGLV
ncbi:MAG: EamA family transporter, partial [Planctomycetes bacterium]|nr:EamA family transporter [Planctomycetota bacterium]